MMSDSRKSRNGHRVMLTVSKDFKLTTIRAMNESSAPLDIITPYQLRELKVRAGALDLTGVREAFFEAVEEEWGDEMLDGYESGPGDDCQETYDCSCSSCLGEDHPAYEGYFYDPTPFSVEAMTMLVATYGGDEEGFMDLVADEVFIRRTYVGTSYLRALERDSRETPSLVVCLPCSHRRSARSSREHQHTPNTPLDSDSMVHDQYRRLLVIKSVEALAILKLAALEATVPPSKSTASKSKSKSKTSNSSSSSSSSSSSEVEVCPILKRCVMYDNTGGST